jgi:PKD repeat protein
MFSTDFLAIFTSILHRRCKNIGHVQTMKHIRFFTFAEQPTTMKKLYRLLLLAALPVATVFSALANQVVVKGVVKYANGTPAAHTELILRTDTLQNATTCRLVKFALTNPNGVFRDTLRCTGNDIRMVLVGIRNCDGNMLYKSFLVPATGIIEADFVLCNPTACKPEFDWKPASNAGLSFLFNSGMSVAGPGDSIVARIWTFGDGTAIEGNRIDPPKTFSAAGIYNVCLKIKTRNGCTNTLCRTVVISVNNDCKPEFNFERLVNTAFSFRFSSVPSIITAGDSIVSRKWYFGDGDSLVAGNEASPQHNYRQGGAYRVCLAMKTARGCEKTVCKEILIPITTVQCQAMVKFEILPTLSPAGTSIRFNSTGSAVTPGDSIVKRRWDFGDGTGIADGNMAAPIKTYGKAGTYQVCYWMVTAKGCESKTCVTVVTPNNQPRCEAAIKWGTAGLKAEMSSASSFVMPGDAIVSRTWRFGDGTSLSGNLVSTTHLYKAAGTYELCLDIKTKLGCASTICQKLTVTEAVAKCVAFFNYEQISTNPLRIRFNSNMSYSQNTDDPIVSRTWTFGNGQQLTGNEISPAMTYRYGGIYEVCLKIVTAKGCETKWCGRIEVKGSTQNTDNARMIQIVSTYPNPARANFNAVIWSKNPNVKADIAIFDVYGQRKWGVSVILPQDNLTFAVPTAQLLPGPYILRVTTQYGIINHNFFKMN